MIVAQPTDVSYAASSVCVCWYYNWYMMKKVAKLWLNPLHSTTLIGTVKQNIKKYKVWQYAFRLQSLEVNSFVQRNTVILKYCTVGKCSQIHCLRSFYVFKLNQTSIFVIGLSQVVEDATHWLAKRAEKDLPACVRCWYANSIATPIKL